MAKRHKDLTDWKVVIEDEPSIVPSTPTRRSRRGTGQVQVESLKLLRDSDGTTLEKGDCILISGPLKRIELEHDTYVGVILDIKFGIKDFLDLQVAPFVRQSEVPSSTLRESLEPNEYELLLTPETINVYLKDFVEKVPVVTKAQLTELALDATSAFFCYRGTDRFKEKVSEEFDFTDWLKLLQQNVTQAINYVAERTLIIISPSKAKSSVKSLKQRLETAASPLKRSYVESSEDEYSSSAAEKDSEDDSESDHESEPEPEVKPLPKKKKIESATSSPRKRAREGTRGTDAFKQVIDVLSPFNKGFKVKTGNSLSNLPSLAREELSSPIKENRGSKAFRELKEKLHTSTRIANLPCREDHFDEIYLNLESAIMEKAGCSLYVSGTPGVGKTATIREAIGALRDNVEQGYVDDFDYLEINCLKLLSPNSAYEKLWEHLSGIKVTPSNAVVLLGEHFKRKREERKPLIVLLDELDHLVTRTQMVLYNFFDWPTLSNSKLIVIAVANTMDLPERVFLNKISSRLGLRRIAFKGYTEDELGVIIRHRLTLLSEENKRKVTVTDDAMRFASKKVSLVSGDARRALMICRRAVELAEKEFLESTDTDGVPEEEQSYSVKTSHIGMAITETVNSPVAQLLDSLPFAAKLVLAGVLLRIRRSGLGENTLGDITDEMKNSLSLLTTKESNNALKDISNTATYMTLLYGKAGVDDPTYNVRMHQMACVVNELAEHGILLQQNVASERYRLISLNISEDEVLSALRKDKEISAML